MPLLMAIAPKSGDHPSVRRGAACSFLREYIRQVMEARTTRQPTMNGMIVCKNGIRAVATHPRRINVNRSPRHDATAGAMLSGSRSYFLQRTTMH